MNKKKLKPILIFILVLAVILTGYLFVRAQSVSDDFSTTDNVADTWNTTVDTSGGEVALTEYTCNDSNWFCSLNNVCANDLGDGDYIVVAKTDASTTSYKWKPTQTACDRPQCGQDGGNDGDNLQADNTIQFEGYPARDLCKTAGGRLPTKSELNCIYTNRVSFGDNFQSASYWSATESSSISAWHQSFANGTQYNNYYKDDEHYVRCVFGR